MATTVSSSSSFGDVARSSELRGRLLFLFGALIVYRIGTFIPVPGINPAEVARFFVSQGYVVIYQDCRGRYASEGEFVKYLSDGFDGYDTCAWIVRQPWCNGRIGTMGLSYAAHTQGALGCLNPPGLVAQVLDCGGFANAWKRSDAAVST